MGALHSSPCSAVPPQPCPPLCTGSQSCHLVCGCGVQSAVCRRTGRGGADVHRIVQQQLRRGRGVCSPARARCRKCAPVLLPYAFWMFSHACVQSFASHLPLPDASWRLRRSSPRLLLLALFFPPFCRLWLLVLCTTPQLSAVFTQSMMDSALLLFASELLQPFASELLQPSASPLRFAVCGTIAAQMRGGRHGRDGVCGAQQPWLQARIFWLRCCTLIRVPVAAARCRTLLSFLRAFCFCSSRWRC